jgi:uncharacterized protein
MNPVSFFEIPVNDLQRATDFYEFVFECKLELQTIDGNEMAMFAFNESGFGASGALVKGEAYVTSKHGTRVYFSVSDIDDHLSRILQKGGQVMYPKTDIDDYGYVAEFEDSEGNCVALHEERWLG